ncbi:MAG: hypothetical protein GWN01_08080 [Nitrosopumilaceae archaeon]|nr:DNA replication complex GINS family protein [Nitrosopumilaceae archaeon]NIU00877.1 DNA replication complex GINS family protein [Nitrosopumilaceae archaeon]NIU87330.1 hypothetical protein [Nitrosopumilaceae archaeon]NIV65858.1 hypothetical protein [Nitrosopumilaceae archaeon]NIX61479.1 hypothetical protein [Nitrosopumilaceae archaeon]
MSESKEIDINSLYSIVLRETEMEQIQELDSDLYKTISKYVGELKRQEFDGVENKVKNSLIDMITELISLLIKLRLEKIVNLGDFDISNLLDEEKYILDSEEEKLDRKEMIVNATINGKVKLLESISKKHKTKPMVVRFIKEMDEMVGADLEKYGPFKTEDIATIPYENAKALISKNIAVKVRLEY